MLCGLDEAGGDEQCRHWERGGTMMCTQTITVLRGMHATNFEMCPSSTEWDWSKFGLGGAQLLLRSQTRYFAAGTIIADSRDQANGILVVTSGQVCHA